MAIKKFAYLPRVVKSWRNTRILVWLQDYYIKTEEMLTPLNETESRIGEEYALKIGSFSKEL